MNLTNEFWEKIYKDNASKMLGICRRYVKSKEVAEDLMQEAFLIAINKVDTFIGKGSFEAWLRRIAVNSALMYLRQQKAHRIFDDLIENDSDYENMNLDNDIRGIIEQADFSDIELLEVIDSLPEHHKLVFNLYIIDGFSHIQIGKELNISPGTSKSHLARARKKIQHLLYQKAIEKNYDKKKRKRALLLLFVPYNFIDTIYREKLRSFSIEPVKTLSFNGISNLHRISIQKTVFFVSKKLFFGALSGILIVSTILYFKSISESPAIIDTTPTQINVIDTFLKQQTDSIQVEQEAKLDFEKVELKPQRKEGPVIVIKQIIQRKTVFIKDTLKIIDTTNVL